MPGRSYQAGQYKLNDSQRANISSCQGCGAPILWAKTAEGKAIPLDPRAIVYTVDAAELKDDGQVLSLRVTQEKGEVVGRAFVSHFATCPKASNFSSGGRAKPAAPAAAAAGPTLTSPALDPEGT